MCSKMLDKIVYNTVLSQTFSPCGKYLVAGNIYGQIAVFDLDRIVNPLVELLTSDFNKPKHIHTFEPQNQVCSLASTEKFLIVGSVNVICGWDWKSILGPKLGKSIWTLNIPSESSFEQCDINSIWLSDDKETLYAGCGDNKIYMFNLEDGKLIKTLEGHTDFIHCVHGKGQQLVSSSEDGFVRLWDVRMKKCHNKIEPSSNSKVNRPELGKWIGAVSISDDWIVCGGGPRLSLWHARSLDVVTTCDLPDRGIHVASFHDDHIIAGGAAKHLYQMNYSGEVKVELPVSATTVYSAILRTSPSQLLSIAGSSCGIDICTTLNYRDQVLMFR